MHCCNKNTFLCRTPATRRERVLHRQETNNIIAQYTRNGDRGRIVASHTGLALGCFGVGLTGSLPFRRSLHG
jgi:hypothetical protein